MSDSKITGNAYGDFFLGVGVVACMIGVKKLVGLFSAPSLQKIHDRAGCVIPKMGKDDEITIWGFHKTGDYICYQEGIVDSSAYVARVEVYLRMLGKAYVKNITMDLSENPRHRVPFANVYGVMVDDSFRIIHEINKHFSIDPHQSLTQEQITTGHLIERLLTQSFYFVAIYILFATKQGRALVQDDFSKVLPSFLVPVIMPMVFRDQMNRLLGQGIAKYTVEQIFEKGEADVTAIANVLGSNQYILGTSEPTMYDTDVYAFLSPLLYDTKFNDLDWVVRVFKNHPTLGQYINRLRSQIFPELKAKIQ